MLKFYVMKRTEVVNIRYAACDVYIDRAGRGEDGYFRNPFRLLPGMSRGATLDRYRSYFYGRLRTDPEFRQRIHALKGKRLGCFCKPYPWIRGGGASGSGLGHGAHDLSFADTTRPL